MKFNLERTLYWTPRILGIFFILFLAVFALDVFTPNYTLIEQLIGFFMHLIPNYILALILFIALKNEKIGGILFLIAAAVLAWISRTFLLTNITLIVPLALVGSLFLWHNYLIKGRWI